jgi:hypothetical protein
MSYPFSLKKGFDQKTGPLAQPTLRTVAQALFVGQYWPIPPQLPHWGDFIRGQPPARCR